FPWLAESERRLRWMGALVESEPLTDGSPAVGSRYRDAFEDHGQRIELEAELVEVEPSRLLTAKLVAKGFESTSSQHLEDAKGGTRLTATIETRYTKLTTRLLAPVVTRHAQKQLEEDLARLKQLVEGEAPG
ncbi:MAG: SRPBCC family protein, partial [Gaiellaceae bacterium]